MNTNYAPPAELGGIQTKALIVGIIGVVAALAGAVVGKNWNLFFQSYLVGYVFWVGIALGCLGLMMIQYLAGAGWGLLIRRILESGAHTLVLMAILFIPIAFGIHSLYEWSHDLTGIESETARHLIEHRRIWLNQTGFILRTALYFAIWLLFAFVLIKCSHRQDETGDPKQLQKAQNWSGPGFMIYGLAVTFAAVDWIMSLDAEWYSTIFGLLMIAGQGVLTLSFVVSVCIVLMKRDGLEHVYKPKLFHDLGKLMLALTMVWAYFSFSQLLIIWAGNLPEEIPWYLERFKGVWRYLGFALIGLHFFMPYFLLLSRDLKKSARRLIWVARLIIVMRFIDLLWLMVPEFQKEHNASIHGLWMYVVATIGIGGLWLWWFVGQLRKRPLLPLNDPQLHEALAAGGDH